MRLTKNPVLLGFLPLLFLTPGWAQERAQSIEGRLLEVLWKKGIISEREYKELQDLEKKMREDASVETALKSQIDEMVNVLQETPPSTRYRMGKGFAWTTNDELFSLTIGARLQFRWETHWRENAELGTTYGFHIPRARLNFTGNAFSKAITYKFQIEIAGDEAETNVRVPGQTIMGGAGGTTSPFSEVFESRNRLTELKDAHIDFGMWDPFNIRIGQFKAPYSRHQLLSSSALAAVDRSPVDRVFVPARDQGVMVFGAFGGENDDVFEYEFGVFNGLGENRPGFDEGLLYVGRVAIHPFGNVEYHEADLHPERGFRVALGLNAWYNDNLSNDNDNDNWSVGADFALLWKGFSLIGEVHYRENRLPNPNSEILGWFAQLGYMVIEKTLQVGGRVTNIDWEPNAAEVRREYLFFIGYFFPDVSMKASLDIARIEQHSVDIGSDLDEWQLRLQYEIIF